MNVVSSPQISPVDALAPNVTIVRDRDLKEGIRLHEVIRVGPRSNMPSVIIKRWGDTRNTHGKTHVRAQQDSSCLHTKVRADCKKLPLLAPRCGLADRRMWISKFLLFKPPCLWCFLWQPIHTNTNDNSRRKIIQCYEKSKKGRERMTQTHSHPEQNASGDVINPDPDPVS